MKTSFFSNEYKKYILLFPVCILIGSVLINIAGMDKINEWGLFTKDFSVDNKYSLGCVIKYVFSKRGGHLFILFLMCFSTLKDKLFLIVVGWLGIVFGAIQSALFIQYDIKGIICFIVCICIHCFIYVLGTVGLLIISEKNDEKTLLLRISVVGTVFLFGLLIESIMAWQIFPMFI